MPEPRRDSPRFSVAGLILIILGLVFLLQSLGVLRWGLWGNLWRLWPVLLILIGLNILWGRRSPWLMLALTGIVLATAIGAAALLAGSPPSPVATPFSQPLRGVERAEVEIYFGAGELVIDSLPATSANLAEGVSDPGVKLDFRVRDSTSVLRLSLPGPRVYWLLGERGFQLQASLNPRIPLELTVKTGASDTQIDLTNLKVTQLRIDAGAARLNLRLPAMAGMTEAEVKAGAAQVNITIPQGVAARIRAKSGLASFTVDTSRFPKGNDGVYESPDYATASNRVDLQVDSGVASVDIR